MKRVIVNLALLAAAVPSAAYAHPPGYYRQHRDEGEAVADACKTSPDSHDEHDQNAGSALFRFGGSFTPSQAESMVTP